MPLLHELPTTCNPSKFARKLCRPGLMWAYHIVFGLESNIPKCCIIAFTLRNFRKYKYSPCYGNHACHAEFSHCWFHRRKDHLHIVPDPRYIGYY